MAHNGGNGPYNYQVTDDSGEARLSMFSKTGAPPLQEGSTYTLKQSITTRGPQGLSASVYNGKHSINGNTQSTIIEQGGGATADAIPQSYDTPQAAPAPAAAAPAPTGKKNADELTSHFLKIYSLARKKASEASISEDHAHEIGLKPSNVFRHIGLEKNTSVNFFSYCY